MINAAIQGVESSVDIPLLMSIQAVKVNFNIYKEDTRMRRPTQMQNNSYIKILLKLTISQQLFLSKH